MRRRNNMEKLSSSEVNDGVEICSGLMFETPSQDTAIPEIVDAQLTIAVLNKALQKLARRDPRSVDMLRRYFMEDHTYVEIGKTYGLTGGGVSKCVRQGVNRLRTYYLNYLYEDRKSR
jgi:DNA-directed RNA polymerase specialized sigma subunit